MGILTRFKNVGNYVSYYYVLKNDVDYDPEKVFERFKTEAQALALIQKKGSGSKPGAGTGAGSSSGSKPRNQKPTA